MHGVAALSGVGWLAMAGAQDVQVQGHTSGLLQRRTAEVARDRHSDLTGMTQS